MPERLRDAPAGGTPASRYEKIRTAHDAICSVEDFVKAVLTACDAASVRSIECRWITTAPVQQVHLFWY
jgi:hypothetical protein